MGIIMAIIYAFLMIGGVFLGGFIVGRNSK
jgi:hypothetical protein